MSVVNWFGKQRAPVTLGLIGTMVVVSLVSMGLAPKVAGSLAFDKQWLAHPWSLVTYSFYFPGGMNLIGLLFLVYWGLLLGGMVEREMGSRRFLGFVGVVAVGSALMMWGGAMVFEAPLNLFGPFFIDAAVAVAWGTRFSTYQLNIFGILPLQARVVGWLFTIGLYLAYGIGQPLMGICALIPLGLVWAFAENNLPVSFGSRPIEQEHAAGRGSVRYDDAYYEDVKKREQEREERERLRKLFGE